MKIFNPKITPHTHTKITMVVSVLISLLTINSQSALANVDPMLGEIEYVGFNFCPRGWAQANGQFLPINQNQALFALLGTTYGGDGRTTFALPDYRGRTALGLNADVRLGQKVGSEYVQLTADNVPAHTHTASTITTVNASSGRGRTPSPVGAVLANDGADRIYSDALADVALSGQAITSTTTVSSTANDSVYNMQPYLPLTACIAMQGVFPSRN